MVFSVLNNFKREKKSFADLISYAFYNSHIVRAIIMPILEKINITRPVYKSYGST